MAMMDKYLEDISIYGPLASTKNKYTEETLSIDSLDELDEPLRKKLKCNKSLSIFPSKRTNENKILLENEHSKWNDDTLKKKKSKKLPSPNIRVYLHDADSVIKRIKKSEPYKAFYYALCEGGPDDTLKTKKSKKLRSPPICVYPYAADSVMKREYVSEKRYKASAYALCEVLSNDSESDTPKTADKTYGLSRDGDSGAQYFPQSPVDTLKKKKKNSKKLPSPPINIYQHIADSVMKRENESEKRYKASAYALCEDDTLKKKKSKKLRSPPISVYHHAADSVIKRINESEKRYDECAYALCEVLSNDSESDTPKPADKTYGRSRDGDSGAQYFPQSPVDTLKKKNSKKLRSPPINIYQHIADSVMKREYESEKRYKASAYALCEVCSNDSESNTPKPADETYGLSRDGDSGAQYFPQSPEDRSAVQANSNAEPEMLQRSTKLFFMC